MSARHWREYYARRTNSVTEKEQRLYYPIINISAHTDEPLQVQEIKEYKGLEPESSVLLSHEDEDPTESANLNTDSGVVITNSLAIETDRDERSLQPIGMTLIEISESDPAYSLSGASPGLNLLRIKRDSELNRSSIDGKNHPHSSWGWQQHLLPWKWLEVTGVRSGQRQWLCSRCFLWLFLVLFLVFTTAIVTWAVTKAHYTEAKNEPMPLIIRGTIRFLIMENHGIFPIDSILNKRAAASVEAHKDVINRRRLCTNAGRSYCDVQWRRRIKEEFAFNCTKDEWYQSQAAWPLEEKVASYIVHNSTFCFWHGCVALDICCWSAPTGPSVAIFAYALHLRLSHKDTHSISSDTLGALASKFCIMMAQSLLHRILELAIFGDLRDRIQEKEVCTQQIILPHADNNCESVERCVRQ